MSLQTDALLSRKQDLARDKARTRLTKAPPPVDLTVNRTESSKSMTTTDGSGTVDSHIKRTGSACGHQDDLARNRSQSHGTCLTKTPPSNHSYTSCAGTTGVNQTTGYATLKKKSSLVPLTEIVRDSCSREAQQAGSITLPEPREKPSGRGRIPECSTMCHKRADFKQSAGDPQVQLALQTPGIHRPSVPLGQDESASTYVATLRYRHLPFTVTRHPPVDPPCLVITHARPGSPHHVKYHATLDPSLLIPPPACHTQRERERYTRTRSQQMLDTAKRLSRTVANVQDANEKKIDAMASNIIHSKMTSSQSTLKEFAVTEFERLMLSKLERLGF